MEFKSKGRFRPAPGKDFDLDPVPSIEAQTKGFLVRSIVLSAMFALLATGVYGLYYQKFSPVAGTWAVVGPIVGAMVNHYFSGHRKDSG